MYIKISEVLIELMLVNIITSVSINDTFNETVAEKIESVTIDENTVIEDWMLDDKTFFSKYINYVADVSIENSELIFETAKKYEIDHWDLAAVMISEKSGPDYDFSLEGASKRDYDYDWDNSVVGKEGEIGYFQIKPYWARKAGYKGDDLFDEKINIDVAGFVVWHNMNSHKKCEKKVNYHEWIAHYKCGKSDRNKFNGFCRFKQNQWHRIRYSLGKKDSPDFKKFNKELKKDLDDRIEDVKKKYNIK